MKIFIKAKGLRLFLYIPYFLITKRLFKHVLIKSNFEVNVQLDEISSLFLKELKAFAKKNRRFVLLDVHSKDNEKVKIVL
ncbi:MAG: hypothetical protein WCZ47_04815 [Bacilli bacterium]|jgi:hypothetical protein|nr:hypothetical protein [Bacilli bacterium]NLN80378.1 hypothetical protein [Erysipelotrichia bacterium]